jgi:hypothetical protein
MVVGPVNLLNPGFKDRTIIWESRHQMSQLSPTPLWLYLFNNKIRNI